MSSKRNSLLLTASIAIATLEIATAMERVTALTPACAERDLRAIALIEEHGEAENLTPGVLAQAGLDQLRARLDCLAGHEAQALAIYDAILRIAPATAGLKS